MENVTKKKILYLVTQTEFGGAQKYVYDLARGLDKGKYQVEIGVGEKREGEKEQTWLTDLRSQGFKIWRFKHLVREVNLWHDFWSGFELYHLLSQSRPDVVHLNSSKIGSTGAVVAWLYKKLEQPSLKIIYTAHGFVFTEPLSIWRRKFYRWSERISGYFKDKIICVSEHDKIIGLNNKIARHNKFITIHNGIDLDKLHFLSKEEACKQLASNCELRIANFASLWIGTIANLYPTKGIRYLIRAAKNLVERYPHLIFMVIGEGVQRQWLEEKIKRLNLTQNFFLVGTLARAHQYLKAFDIYCLPSVKEGFPYTLLEAMAAGLPLVATQVGGVVEIIEPEENGLIIPPAKPNKLTEAIEKIINNEQLKNRFIKNNLKKVKKFSLEKMIKETEKVYEEISNQ